MPHMVVQPKLASATAPATTSAARSGSPYCTAAQAAALGRQVSYTTIAPRAAATPGATTIRGARTPAAADCSRPRRVSSPLHTSGLAAHGRSGGAVATSASAGHIFTLQAG